MTRRLKAGQARYRADEPGPSPQTPEFFVIDQSVHAAPSGLRTSPDQDLESPEEPQTGTGGKRSKLAWLFGIIALVLGATFVLQRNPPEDTSQAPAKAQAAPMPVTASQVSTSDVPIYLDGLGTVQASNTVAIRSQVDGKLPA